MRFQSKNAIDVAGEGGPVCPFMHRALDGADASELDVLEVGPKHGLHTKLLSGLKAKSITCVELNEKRGEIDKWWEHITVPKEIVYSDILKFTTERRFGLILFSGVLYHNQEQLRILRKLHTLAAPGCRLILETATTRTKALQTLNVIEVYWPEGYRRTKTVRFLPSKLACRSLLEMSGWKIDTTSDDMKELRNINRITIACTKIDGFKLFTYNEIDNSLIEGGDDDAV